MFKETMHFQLISCPIQYMSMVILLAWTLIIGHLDGSQVVTDVVGPVNVMYWHVRPNVTISMTPKDVISMTHQRSSWHVRPNSPLALTHQNTLLV